MPTYQANVRGTWIFHAVLGAAGAVLASTFGQLGTASAKSSFESPYTLTQTYNAALRLVRVDLGLTVTERDPSAAYILFDYKSTESGRRVAPGSIEMLEAGRAVKVVVQLGQMPRYHEQVMSDALAKKLRDEYGEPAPRGNQHEVADAGADGASSGF
jgi:hypothetical protein